MVLEKELAELAGKVEDTIETVGGRKRRSSKKHGKKRRVKKTQRKRKTGRKNMRKR